MYKKFLSVMSLVLLNVSLVFGAPSERPNDFPPRQDRLDASSPYAKMQLQRAQQLLTTLIPNTQNYQLILSNDPRFGAEAFPAHVFSDKPTLIIYQGSLTYQHSNEELAFMLAHELGHVHLNHSAQMDVIMDQFFYGPPIKYIGMPLTIYFQKFQEQEADMFGLYLYKKAGYNEQFFARQLNVIKNESAYQTQMSLMHGMGLEPGSLSMKDPHFCMRERFEHLIRHLKDSPQQIAQQLGIAPGQQARS